MPEFISKLQYKTCEKGEYYDEKARDLLETLELIKNFPWAREQYADIDLTGPSVTIKDNGGNYLKAGIYYGGRFSLYYLDSKNRLYEYHQIKIEKVYEKVTEFFNGHLDLQNFEKQGWILAVNKFFLTKPFEYRIKWWEIWLMMTYWFVPVIVCLLFFISAEFTTPSFKGVFILIPAILFGYPIMYVLNKFDKQQGQYLKISRGNAIFFFGQEPDQIKSYNKADINKIIEYVNKNYRSSNPFEVYNVVFNDGSSIWFSNALLSSYGLSFKFSDKWKINKVRVERRSYNILPLLGE